MAASNVINGKAFEYALATQYYEYLQRNKVNVELVENDAINIARNYYNEFSSSEKKRFDNSALATISTMIKIEPGLTHPNNEEDLLKITLSADGDGIGGDVRDVVFKRESHIWEIGFSAKNNNDAVKHSRLSSVLDFGKSWVGVPCSTTYWSEIKPIFDYLEEQKKRNSYWSELGSDKIEVVYKPLLKAFREELLFINENNKNIPQKLVQYLIGKYPFYKIIKDDANNMVIVKAFNIGGGLNKKLGGEQSRYKIPRINLPTRIVEFDFMHDHEDNTLDMILDGGWEISFRIHNAKSEVETSLKFDIRLLGNPPVLFTQHIFQD
jgi:hypothetical protein